MSAEHIQSIARKGDPAKVVMLRDYVLKNAREAIRRRNLAYKLGCKQDVERFQAKNDRLVDRLPYPGRHLQDEA